jgi:hypothetical protein
MSALLVACKRLAQANCQQRFSLGTSAEQLKKGSPMLIDNAGKHVNSNGPVLILRTQDLIHQFAWYMA